MFVPQETVLTVAGAAEVPGRALTPAERTDAEAPGAAAMPTTQIAAATTAKNDLRRLTLCAGKGDRSRRACMVPSPSSAQNPQSSSLDRERTSIGNDFSSIRKDAATRRRHPGPS